MGTDAAVAIVLIVLNLEGAAKGSKIGFLRATIRTRVAYIMMVVVNCYSNLEWLISGEQTGDVLKVEWSLAL